MIINIREIFNKCVDSGYLWIVIVVASLIFPLTVIAIALSISTFVLLDIAEAIMK